VVQIGGQPIRNADDLSASVNDHKPGDAVKIVVDRNGERRTLTVTLGSQPSTSPLN
jgi:S1-C subfamily serine protease